MKIEALHPLFAARVEGLDLRRPLSAQELAAVHEAMNRHAVLVLPGQAIDDEQQLAFSRQLGTLEETANPSARLNSRHFSDISNLGVDDQLLADDDERRLYGLANRLWHTDSSFAAVPAKYSLLHARQVPATGGETEFADMRAAWDALPTEDQAALIGLQAEHALAHSRAMIGFALRGDKAQLPPAQHPLVHRHAGSGRASLYLASHMSHIVGQAIPEGRLRLIELMAFATQPRFVHRHHWTAGDLVIWDNRSTMHRGRPFPAGVRRDLRRTTLSNEVPLTPLA